MNVYVVLYYSQLSDETFCDVKEVFDTRESAFEYAKSMYKKALRYKKEDKYGNYKDIKSKVLTYGFTIYEGMGDFYETWEILEKEIRTKSK